MKTKAHIPRFSHGRALASAAGVAALGFTTLARAAPEIAFDRTTHEFGTRRSVETVRTTFTVRNTGDDPLEIVNVKTSCGCTAASLDKQTIQPRESVPLNVSFSLRGRSGPQHKTVTVFSNDPEEPVSRLVLRGTIVEAPSWTPGTINFGRLGPEERASRNAVLSGFGEMPSVKNVKVDSKAFRAQWVTDHDGQGHLRVDTAPPLAAGSHRAEIAVKTDHPDYPTMKLTVFAYVPPPIRVVPSTLLIMEDNGRGGKATIMLLGSVKSFQVKRVGHPPAITATVRSQAPNRWAVHLNGLTPDAGLDGTKIQIETDVEGMETIFVPIRLRRMHAPAIPDKATR